MKICTSICKRTLPVPRSEQFTLSGNCELQGTGNVPGQISMDILHQMEAIVFISLQIFFATHAVLKIGEYISDLFSHVMSLDQSCPSKNISYLTNKEA